MQNTSESLPFWYGCHGGSDDEQPFAFRGLDH
jgi:hypothetical protein